MNNIAAPNAGLDAEELLFLGVQAMKQNRDEDAISCLKRGLALDPGSGVMHHLLGAVYAQLGMTARAIGEMAEAIACAPELKIARFQLGLLHFTAADFAAAEEVWLPLAELPSDDPLRLFHSGLLHLARNEFAPCVADLRRGVDLNTEHLALNEDMRKLADRTEAVIGGGLDAAGPAPTVDLGRHVLLSGYQDLGADKPKN